MRGPPYELRRSLTSLILAQRCRGVTGLPALLRCEPQWLFHDTLSYVDSLIAADNAGAAVSAQPPGAQPPPQRTRLRYELLGCAVHGHELLGPADAAATGHGDLLHRPGEDARVGWLRCLRCDAWVPLLETDMPAPRTGDDRVDDTLTPPLRGRPLRDRFVLRLIAADRTVHFLVLGAVAVAIFLFAHDRIQLRGEYIGVLNRLQGALGGPLTESTSHGLLHDVNRLFAIPVGTLYLYGVGIAVYALVNGIEAVGLWSARRWAEYLTLIEVVVLLPIEIRELTLSLSPLKILTLVLNLAVVAYLLWVHRLLGVRGGGRADRAEKEHDSGWAPLYRTTPWVPAGGDAPSSLA